MMLWFVAELETSPKESGIYIKGIRFLSVLGIISVLSGCYIEATIGSGGEIKSYSGTRDCTANSLCQFDITDTNFSESFFAMAESGYVFSHWKKAPGYFCGGSTDPTCALTLTQFAGNSGVEGLMDSDTTFYIMPIFGLAESGAFSQEARAVFGNMSALSPSEMSSIATFVDGQVDTGNWSLVDEMYCFALNEKDSLRGFKGYSNADSSSGMTHSAGAGYIAHASSSYINSNIVPATLAASSGKKFAMDDAMASVYLHEATRVGDKKYYLFGAYSSLSGKTEFALDYRGNPSLLRATLHSGSARASTEASTPSAIVATIVRRGSGIGTIEVWLNDSQEVSRAASGTAMADRPIHIAGRSNAQNHASGSSQNATYSIFAIGGGNGFDVDAWQLGVRELLYDLGHRPQVYVSGGAEGAVFSGYGTSDSPYSLITGSPLENLTGDQYGLKILFKDDTVLFDHMEWRDISRFQLGATNDGTNKPIIDASQLISLSDTPTRTWTEESHGIYSAPFPAYPGDIGIYITDDSGTTYHMAHWRKSQADFLNPSYDQYSAGYIKWFDFTSNVMYVKSLMDLTTDEGSSASMMRIGKYKKVLRMSSSSMRTVNDITIRDLRFQRGSNSIIKIGGIGDGLRVDNVEAHEAGDWGWKKPDLQDRESGFHAFAIIGDRANKATGVHFSNIQTHSQWNINGNAIETRNLKGAIFEDWVAYDLGNNVYELWEEMENSIFRRTKAWNAKALVWIANEENTSNPDRDQVHSNNLIENNFFRSYKKYGMPTGDKAAILVASGVNNIIQNNTFVGMRTEIIKENLKYNGAISGNIYRNNIIYMADTPRNKGIIALAGPAGDAILDNNVIYTLDDDPDSVQIITEHINHVSEVKRTLTEWQSFGYYTSNVAAHPALIDVKKETDNPADADGPDLHIGLGSAALGLADSNMPSDDVTGAPRFENTAGAYGQR